MHIEEWKTKMIGFGCDGASANMAMGGLRGQLQSEFPWIFVFWCLAHRLELSVKDALKSTFFSTIDDLLLRMYYIYEKSPKKCHELEDIMVELKASLESSEISSKGGNHLVAHKVAALERVIERFGAYSRRQIKVPIRNRRTLVVLSVGRVRVGRVRVITEDTLEPCHLRLVLSTSLIALALAAVSITKQKTILLDLLITLGEGDKALKCLP